MNFVPFFAYFVTAAFLTTLSIKYLHLNQRASQKQKLLIFRTIKLFFKDHPSYKWKFFAISILYVGICFITTDGGVYSHVEAGKMIGITYALAISLFLSASSYNREDK